MIRKIVIGTLLLSAVIFFNGMAVVSAFEEDAKPYEVAERFRGGEYKEKAKDFDMSKEEFVNYRNEAREVHQQERMTARQERLFDAVERGCITKEEMAEKMQKRGNRFSH